MEMKFTYTVHPVNASWTLQIRKILVREDNGEATVLSTAPAATIEGSLTDFLRYTALNYTALHSLIVKGLEFTEPSVIEALDILLAFRKVLFYKPDDTGNQHLLRPALEFLAHTDSFDLAIEGIKTVVTNRQVWKAVLSDAILDRCAALVDKA